MDMGAAFLKSARAEGHAPQAVICIDPFHAVKLVTDALDVVRRATWNQLRQLPDQAAAKKFKGARWSLLKRPENLTDDQAATLRRSVRMTVAGWSEERGAHHRCGDAEGLALEGPRIGEGDDAGLAAL